MYASVRHYKMGAGSIDSLMHHVDVYVRDNLREFELTRTGVTAGEVLVSRVAPEALEDAHHPLPSRRAR